MPSAPLCSPPPPQAYLFDWVRELGVHHIFGVPGTPGLPLLGGTYYPENDVTYLEYPHESLALSAALGTTRLTGLPGVVVVHATPGLPNSLRALVGPARSRLPLVILCCQLSPAASLVAQVRPYAKWACEVPAATEIPQVLRYAFQEALASPAGLVFVAIPWEFTQGCLGEPAPATRLPGPGTPVVPGPPAWLTPVGEPQRELRRPAPGKPAPTPPGYVSIFPGSDYGSQVASRRPGSCRASATSTRPTPPPPLARGAG